MFAVHARKWFVVSWLNVHVSCTQIYVCLSTMFVTCHEQIRILSWTCIIQLDTHYLCLYICLCVFKILTQQLQTHYFKTITSATHKHTHTHTHTHKHTHAHTYIHYIHRIFHVPSHKVLLTFENIWRPVLLSCWVIIYVILAHINTGVPALLLFCEVLQFYLRFTDNTKAVSATSGLFFLMHKAGRHGTLAYLLSTYYQCKPRTVFSSHQATCCLGTCSWKLI